MPDTLSQLPGIVDIALPVPPGDTSPLSVLLPVALLVTLLLIFLWYYRRSLRGRARRKLKQLQINTQPEQDRFAWQLAAVVRIGLGLNRLTSSTPLPEKLFLQASRWQRFIDQLNQARYAGRKLSETERRQLIADARYWLRKWP